ncbi:MAG: Rpn family recombination-promoting nuclease/putative transposase, partial [Lachnospiraceae bacterium]|nr:Rpn family recombination-promoting nuclease/putative transposase [Lachnospiraceae bacterium]
MKNYTPVYVYPLTEDDGWKSLTGELRVKMTNDYLFRALLQSDNDTLKALLASLLRIDVSDIRSAEVTNPLLLGESIEDKTFIMDVNVELNNDTLIDLEMQVIRESGWTERSLSYICREFDQLNSGMAYIEAKPVRQIAFCDFTLFKDAPEFYATYKLINERNKKKVYSEKLV